MADKYDLAVFIGRFQPFHNGHLHVVMEAFKIAKKVIILVGSASSPRCYRNPFTYDERASMIDRAIAQATNGSINFSVFPLEDAAYNDVKWVTSIQDRVDRVCSKFIRKADPKICLVGHSKDNTSYYLKMFPQWDAVEISNYKEFSSTPMRNVYFSNIGHMWVKDCDGHKEGDLLQDALVPTATKEFLEQFLDSENYKKIRSEYEFILDYKKAWVNAPYPPIFVTVDAIVVQSGHILLVKRGAAPGKGLWALPGGFINQDEYIDSAVFRELREETGLKIPEKVLRGCVIKREVFDDPNRSSRGRTITHAYLIHLSPNEELPKVKGGDDAEKAKWIPISELDPNYFYEDHFHIIMNMISNL